MVGEGSLNCTLVHFEELIWWREHDCGEVSGRSAEAIAGFESSLKHGRVQALGQTLLVMPLLIFIMGTCMIAWANLCNQFGLKNTSSITSTQTPVVVQAVDQLSQDTPAEQAFGRCIADLVANNWMPPKLKRSAKTLLKLNIGENIVTTTHLEKSSGNKNFDKSITEIASVQELDKIRSSGVYMQRCSMYSLLPPEGCYAQVVLEFSTKSGKKSVVMKSTEFKQLSNN